MWQRKSVPDIKSMETKIKELEEANKSARDSLVEALLELKKKLGCAAMDEGLAQMEFGSEKKE